MLVDIPEEVLTEEKSELPRLPRSDWKLEGVSVSLPNVAVGSRRALSGNP